MSRRTRVCARRASTKTFSLFDTARAATQGKPVFTAAKYVEDPLHPGFVWKFVDHNDESHWLVQADTTKQVPLPVAHADFGGALCCTFTGVEWYVSNRPASGFANLSNGSGDAAFLVVSMTSSVGAQRLLSTRTGGTVIGFSIGYDSGVPTYIIGNGAANIVSLTGSAVPVAPGYFDVSYLEGGGSPEAVLRIKSTTSASANATSPSASAPASTLIVGAQTSAGGNAMSCRFHALLIGPPSARTAIQAYIQQATGIAP